MFESTLEAQGLHGGERRVRTMSAVAAVYAMTVLAGLVASIFHVQGIIDPPLRLEFTPPPRIVLDLGPSRGPAHQGGGSGSHAIVPPRPVPPPPTATPPTIETPPTVEEPPVETGSGYGEGEGHGDAVGEGIDTGGDGPPGFGGGGGIDDGPVLLGEGIERPVLIVRVEPVYPAAARLARLPGRVVVQAVIGLDGAVESVEVLSSTSPLFDAAARDAVRQWRYRPATMNGRPVRIYFTVVVEFVLR